MSFLIRQTLIYAVPLMIVALAGVFAERSGIINLADVYKRQHLLYALVDADGGLIGTLLGRMGVDCNLSLIHIYPRRTSRTAATPVLPV